jgi:hypothetical protein
MFLVIGFKSKDINVMLQKFNRKHNMLNVG